MALPDYSMRQLLEAGVHFGHQAHRWNPKMGEFIFGTRNNIHIIDLAQSVPMLHKALEAVSDTVAKGGRILFVGTKRQAQDAVADAAKRCAQYYVNSRWLGGTLTNWKTISGSISRLRKLDEMLASNEASGYTKKERLDLQREKDVLADKFKQQGKPANMIEKIVESGIKTFYKEVCLLEQPFIFDDKKSVTQALKEAEGKVGGPIKITGFVRFKLGEGVEKQESDFAAEVAAASGVTKN